MAAPTQDDVLIKLADILVPGATKPEDNIVSLGMISALSADEGGDGLQLLAVIEVHPNETPYYEPVRLQAEKAIAGMEGVAKATVILAAHKQAPSAKTGSNPQNEKKLPRGVRHVIAIASAKGGVGKSTTAVNLALALSQSGLSVGILDADVYGPSVPRLMGLRDTVEDDADGNLIPLRPYGITTMSIGFLVPEEAPMIWRGPMVHGALKQMLYEVAWGGLDVLILDMPPGTGDAALSVAQQVPLTGAIIVSTPQDIALLDVRKGIAMFQKVGVPMLGLIENMSYFECPHCHERTDIFGCGGAKRDAERLGIPFLGQMPLDLRVRELSDAGTPIVAIDQVCSQTRLYKEMAEKIKAVLPR